MKVTMRSKGPLTVVTLDLGEFRRRLNFLMKNDRTGHSYPISWAIRREDGLDTTSQEYRLRDLHKLVLNYNTIDNNESFVYFWNSKTTMRYIVEIDRGHEQDFLDRLNSFIADVNKNIAHRLTTYIISIKDSLDKDVDKALEIIERSEGDECRDGV